MALVTINNPTNMSIPIRSADGEDMMLPPTCNSVVDEKFTWNLPNNVFLVRPLTVTVETTLAIEEEKLPVFVGKKVLGKDNEG